MTKLRWYNSAGTTAAGSGLNWFKSSADGALAGTLSLDKAAPYEPGDIVTITVTNGTAPHQWTVIGTWQPTLTVVGATVAFTAPATLDGITITVRYGASIYINVPVQPAGAFVGPSALPAAVLVEVP